MNENIRARHWNIKTYKSTEEIHKLIKGTECIYRIINHNKDVFEETGELKKEHTHIVLSFKHQRKGSGIIKLLELEHNAYLEPCRSLRQSIRYLIHADDENKANYSIEEIIHNDKHIEQYFTEEESDTEKILNIYNDALNYLNKKITLKQFLLLHPEYIYRMANLKYLLDMINKELVTDNTNTNSNNSEDDLPF
jgi:hypothetical protein